MITEQVDVEELRRLEAQEEWGVEELEKIAQQWRAIIAALEDRERLRAARSLLNIDG